MFIIELVLYYIMSHMTSNQQTLVKARKAARVSFALLIFGGASLLLIGIATSYLPNILNGAVILAGSVLPFVASKLIEKKLEPTLN